MKHATRKTISKSIVLDSHTIAYAQTSADDSVQTSADDYFSNTIAYAQTSADDSWAARAGSWRVMDAVNLP